MIQEIEQKIVPKKIFEQLEYIGRRYPIKQRKHLHALKDKYLLISQHLDQRFGIERTSTRSENYFYKYFNKTTNLKVLQSVWIGPHCIDVFVPSAKFGVEVDGTVHTEEYKMRKDGHRDRNLCRLGFLITCVDNDEINRTMFSLQKYLIERTVINDYQISRMWRDIYLFTLLVHSPSQLGLPEVIK